MATKTISMLTVLADDLTGAADTVGECAAVGGGGWVQLRTIPTTRPSPLTAIDLDARDADTATVRSRFATAVAHAPGTIYVKSDSTLLGQFRAAVEAALTTRRRWHPHARAVVCPAFPAQGRTVEGGRVMLHGTPVLGPDLTELLDGLDVEVADAHSDADLAALAEHADDPDLVWVGSAGLAPHLAARLGVASPPPARRACHAVAVIVGTPHTTTRAQVEHLRAGDEAVTILYGDPADAGFVPAATGLAARSDGLVLSGGATARAVLVALGCDRLHVGGTVAPGLPWSVAVGHDLVVVTKSGGFGGADALAAAVRFLRS